MSGYVDDDSKSVAATGCVITGEEDAQLTLLRLGQSKTWFVSRLSVEGVALVLQCKGDGQTLRSRVNRYTVKRRKERQAKERKVMDAYTRSIITEESDAGLLGIEAARAGPLEWYGQSGTIQPWAGYKYKGWKAKGGQSLPCMRWFIARALLSPFGVSSTPTQENLRFRSTPGPNTPKTEAAGIAWHAKAITDRQLRKMQRGPRAMREQLVRGAYAVADRDGDVCARLRRVLLPLMRLWLPDEDPTPLRWEVTDSESQSEADVEEPALGEAGQGPPRIESGGTRQDAVSAPNPDRSKAHGVDISSVTKARLAKLPKDSSLGGVRYGGTLEPSRQTAEEVEREYKEKKRRMMMTSAVLREQERLRVRDARIAARQQGQRGRSAAAAGGGASADQASTEHAGKPLGRRVFLEPMDGFRLPGRLRWTTKLASAEERSASHGGASHGGAELAAAGAGGGSGGGGLGAPESGWTVPPRQASRRASVDGGAKTSAAGAATEGSVAGRGRDVAGPGKEKGEGKERGKGKASGKSRSRGRRGGRKGRKGDVVEWTRRHPPPPRVRRRADSFDGFPSSVFNEGKQLMPDSIASLLDDKEDGRREAREQEAREKEELLSRGSGAAGAIARRKARREARQKAKGLADDGPTMDPIDGLQAGRRLAEVSSDRRRRRRLLAGATNAGPADVFGSLGLDHRKMRALSPGRGKKFEAFSVRGERLGAVDLSILATYLPQHAPSLRRLDASWCPKFDAPRFKALEETLTIAGRHRLQELDVSYCRLRNQGAAILARALCGSQSFRVLRAAGCLLGAEEAPVIAAIMLSCPNIEEMHLAQNDFRPTGARIMESAVLTVAAREAEQAETQADLGPADAYESKGADDPVPATAEGDKEQGQGQSADDTDASAGGYHVVADPAGVPSGEPLAHDAAAASAEVQQPASGAGADDHSPGSTMRGRAKVALGRLAHRRRPTSALPTSLGAYRSNRETRRIFARIERGIRREAEARKRLRSVERRDSGGSGASGAGDNAGATAATRGKKSVPSSKPGQLDLSMPRKLRLLGLRSCGLGPSGTAAIASLLRAIPTLRRLDVSDNNATAMGASMLTAAARSAGKSLAICTKALIPGYPGSLASVFSEELPGEQAVVQRRLLAERRAKKVEAAASSDVAVAASAGAAGESPSAGPEGAAASGAGESKEEGEGEVERT